MSIDSHISMVDTYTSHDRTQEAIGSEVAQGLEQFEGTFHCE
jgi:hypothetical protein